MSNKQGVYRAIKRLVSSIGGTMTWHPQVPGGVWRVEVHGRRLDVRAANHNVNHLDTLYVPPIPPPAVWEDYTEGEDTPLVSDAFWKLIELLQRLGVRC